MEKFMNELKEAKNPWIKRIGNYLLTRDDIQENLKKENKSLKECFDYILVEISKKAIRDDHVGYAAGDDEELYALAVHYYDEDDIKVEKKGFTTNADGSEDASRLNKQKVDKKEQNIRTEEKETIEKAVASALEEYKSKEKEVIDMAIASALKSYKDEEKELAKKKKEELKAKKEAQKAAKEKENEKQINLFDLLGD